MLTAKQESFCGFIASGQPAIDAYRQAYRDGKPTTISSSANKLLRLPHIATKIDSLKAETASASSWDRVKFVGMLWQRSQAASQAGQHSASIRALELIGRACGLLVDRVEHSGSVGVEHYTRLSMEQLEALARHSEALATSAEPGQAQPALPSGRILDASAEPVSL